MILINLILVKRKVCNTYFLAVDILNPIEGHYIFGEGDNLSSESQNFHLNCLLLDIGERDLDFFFCQKNANSSLKKKHIGCLKISIFVPKMRFCQPMASSSMLFEGPGASYFRPVRLAYRSGFCYFG